MPQPPVTWAGARHATRSNTKNRALPGMGCHDEHGDVEIRAHQECTRRGWVWVWKGEGGGMGGNRGPQDLATRRQPGSLRKPTEGDAAALENSTRAQAPSQDRHITERRAHTPPHTRVEQANKRAAAKARKGSGGRGSPPKPRPSQLSLPPLPAVVAGRRTLPPSGQ